MSLRARLKAFFEARPSVPEISDAESIAELDRAYAAEIDALQHARRAIANVLASERILELERKRVERTSPGDAALGTLAGEIEALRTQRREREATVADALRRITAMRIERALLESRAVSRAAGTTGPAPSAARAFAEPAWLPDPPALASGDGAAEVPGRAPRRVP